ncbi:MAG: AAA family ATPase [Nanoarchaeota archaeon]|nr:AAA family ATPase [Nanoarchaeota archaeon]
MEKDIFEKIYKKHSRFLKHKKVRSNKKLIICFSGIPGSGKTSLAKILEKRYKGVRINSHRIGEIMQELVSKGVINENIAGRKLQVDYQIWLLEAHLFTNNLIILDSGIDRKYNEVFEIARRKGYEIFIIRLNVSEKNLRKRILIRNKENARNYFKSFNKWKREFKEFGKKVNSNIILENEGEVDLVLLFKKLDRLAR